MSNIPLLVHAHVKLARVLSQLDGGSRLNNGAFGLRGVRRIICNGHDCITRLMLSSMLTSYGSGTVLPLSDNNDVSTARTYAILDG